MRKDSFETKRESKPELQKRCLPSSRSPPVAHRSSAWPTVASRGPGELRRGPCAESRGGERAGEPAAAGLETARALHQGERGGGGAKERGDPGAAVDRICRGAPLYLVLDPALAPVAEEMDSSSHPTSSATDRNRGLSRRPGRSLGAAARRPGRSLGAGRGG
jgi:hypothetical protein